MSTQALALPVATPHLSLVDATATHTPLLSPAERAEIGERLLELLWGMHVAGNLRAHALEDGPLPRLQVKLVVPGSGDLVAQVWQADGAFELAVSYGLWQDMVVLRSEGGRLAVLYHEHFSSRADLERAAKDRLLAGFDQLLLVQSWGIRHQS